MDMTDIAPPTLIRPAVTADGEALAHLYNLYVANTIITFEEQALTGADMSARIAEVDAAGLPWLVAERGGVLLGYAYASKWKGRCAYRFSAETTVYLAPDAGRRGLGTRLYAALFAQLRLAGIHSAIGGIALPNAASVALHEKLGMHKVAEFEQVGFKFGRWIDVGYWQRLL
jgi:phosphinothricin acetyltransferase